MSEKARVFISCGQRKDTAYLKEVSIDTLNLMTPEFNIAEQIEKELIDLGYDPYIALEQQNLQGVKEGIFKRLENVEYFLFIDFKREGLFREGELNVESGDFRGSLFSNQELAIATFQGYEVLAFQEKGVKKQDGILKFIQANCIYFSDRSKLPKIVRAEVQKKWNPNWRNELTFDRDDSDFEDNVISFMAKGRLFPIKIINCHKNRIARHCVAFAERIRNLQTNRTIDLELAELKWKNTIAQDVSIPPKQFRYLEGIHVNAENPNTVWLGLNDKIVKWTKLATNFQIRTSGEYEIDYVVFSEDFSPARAKFKLHIGSQMQDITFQKI